jgi:hypothetical protein
LELDMALEWVTAAKDIVLAVAAGFTAVVAVKGINKWRKELEGKASFDAARSLAKAVYRFRDAMKDARSPIIWGGEFKSRQEFGRTQTPTEKADDYWYVYTNRLKLVQNTLPDLDAAALEAEALWGSQARDAVNLLRQTYVQLWAAMDASASDFRTEGYAFQQDPEFGKRIRSEVARSPDDSDPLSMKIASHVRAIEAILKPHLR